MAGMSREWGVGVEVGVSGVKLLTSRAKSLLTCGRTEQINAGIIISVIFFLETVNALSII